MILLISCTVLVMAYAMPFFFHIEPCTLCYYQRVPYFFTACFSALFLYVALQTRSNIIAAYYLCCMFVLFMIGMGISIFHVGVENGWFVYKSTCAGYLETPTSVEDLRRMLEEAPTVPCDIPGPVLFDISLAGWNSILCFILAALTVFMILYKKKSRKN